MNPPLEHAEAREAPAAAERRLREMNESMPGLIFQLREVDGGPMRYTYLSRYCETLYGLSRTEIEADPSILHQRVLAEDLQPLVEAFALARREMRVVREQFRARHLDGHVMWLRTTATPVAIEDGCLWNGYTVEVTEEAEAKLRAQEAEARIREITEALPGMVYEMQFHPKTGGRIVFLTDGVEALYGLSREEVLSDTTALTRLIPMEDRAGMLKTFASSMRGDGPMTSDFRIVRPDGRTRWLRTHSARRGSADLMRWIGHTVDVTESKLLEQEVVQARAAAERANQAKGEFLAKMSHEIRTPMNAVIGLSQLLLRTELAPRQRDYMQKIHGAAHSLLGIINDILDFSKIEAGKLEVERVPFVLSEVLDNVSAVLSLKAEEKGLKFGIVTAADVPRRLLGDPLRLGQVLLNLAGNAVKFTERGEISVSVTRRGGDADDPAPLLYFEVQDTGIGIDGAQIATMFLPFAQADASTTRRFGGSGLGLSISKQLVGLMGGEMFVESQPGSGSCFGFTARFGLPVAAAAQPVGARGLRVLVADDSVEARQILHATLGGFGCEVIEAASGTQAVNLAREAQAAGRPFDLVLMDWQMPEMNGLDAARRMRDASGRAPRTLMVSAYGRPDLARQVQELGLDGLLLKPVNASLLHDHIIDLFGPGSIGPTPMQPGPASLAGLRVLLVEDKVINQQVARELLEQAGIVVDVAGNGREAVSRVCARPYDAVLMDLQMPVMDGLSATREIRAERRFAALPIIAMTANAMSADRERCLAAGMNDHIGKPIDVRILLRTLSTWTRKSDASAQLQSSHSASAAPPFVRGHPMLECAGFDLAAALERLGGQPPLLRKFARSFVDEADEAQALFGMLAEGREQDALLAAHSIKGAAAMLGGEALRAAAAALESALQRSAPYMGLIARVVEEYGEARRRLAAWLAQADAGGVLP
jgi:two-component system sensor histidine kinase/response regulator